MKLQESNFIKILDLKHDTPSAYIFLQMFMIIKTESFTQAFYCKIQDVLTIIPKIKE